jgi:hypothetical protein
VPAADRDARRVRAARVPLRRGHPAPDVSDTLLRGSVLLLERLPAKAAPVELVVSIAAAAGYKKLSWRPKVVSDLRDRARAPLAPMAASGERPPPGLCPCWRLLPHAAWKRGMLAGFAVLAILALGLWRFGATAPGDGGLELLPTDPSGAVLAHARGGMLGETKIWTPCADAGVQGCAGHDAGSVAAVEVSTAPLLKDRGSDSTRFPAATGRATSRADGEAGVAPWHDDPAADFTEPVGATAPGSWSAAATSGDALVLRALRAEDCGLVVEAAGGPVALFGSGASRGTDVRAPVAPGWTAAPRRDVQIRGAVQSSGCARLIGELVAETGAGMELALVEPGGVVEATGHGLTLCAREFGAVLWMVHAHGQFHLTCTPGLQARQTTRRASAATDGAGLRLAVAEADTMDGRELALGTVCGGQCTTRRALPHKQTYGGSGSVFVAPLYAVAGPVRQKTRGVGTSTPAATGEAALRQELVGSELALGTVRGGQGTTRRALPHKTTYGGSGSVFVAPLYAVAGPVRQKTRGVGNSALAGTSVPAPRWAVGVVAACKTAASVHDVCDYSVMSVSVACGACGVMGEHSASVSVEAGSREDFTPRAEPSCMIRWAGCSCWRDRTFWVTQPQLRAFGPRRGSTDTSRMAGSAVE